MSILVTCVSLPCYPIVSSANIGSVKLNWN